MCVGGGGGGREGGRGDWRSREIHLTITVEWLSQPIETTVKQIHKAMLGRQMSILDALIIKIFIG